LAILPGRGATWLFERGVAQFAAESVEPVREIVPNRAYDQTASDLPGRLVAMRQLF
jgi:hypothetical protein